MAEQLPFGDRFVDANGLRFHYLEGGNTAAPPLLCVHGFTEQAHVFDELGQVAAMDYHVFALDLRGHGGSAWAQDGYSNELYMRDLDGFFKAVGLDQVTLVGQSLGGIVGIRYGGQHPERFARVVLVDIGPETGPKAEAQRTSRPQRPMSFGAFDDAVAWSLQGMWFSGPEENIRRDLANKLKQEEDGTWVWRLDPALFTQGQPPANETQLLWAGLTALECPVLEIRGADSHFVSDEILRRMHDANPRLRSVDVAGAAHIVPVDNPQGFIDAISPFLGLGEGLNDRFFYKPSEL